MREAHQVMAQSQRRIDPVSCPLNGVSSMRGFPSMISSHMATELVGQTQDIASFNKIFSPSLQNFTSGILILISHSLVKLINRFSQ